MADNVTTDELEQALQDLATSLGQSTKEYVEGQGFAKDADLQTAIANLQGQITAITEMEDNDHVSLAEKIEKIKEVLSNDEGVVQSIFSLIQENKQAIEDETTRATDAEAALQAQVTAVQNKANSNETAIATNASEITGVKSRVDASEATLTTLTGDESVDGSIKKQIADEAARTNVAIATAKQEAIDEAKSYVDEKVGSDVSGLGDRVSELENAINDTTDENGNLVKGIKSRLSDVEARAEAVLVEAKAYTDSKMIKASSMDICGIGNKFRSALGLADATCGGNGESGDGAVI